MSFTWNIKIVEDKDHVADMLSHRLPDTQLTGWLLAYDEISTWADGITTA